MTVESNHRLQLGLPNLLAEAVTIGVALVQQHLRVRLAGDHVAWRGLQIAQHRHGLDAPLDPLAGAEQPPGQDGELPEAERRLRPRRRPGGRAVRDDADLRHVDGVPGREPFARSRRHRDDGIGLGHHRLEDLTLVRRRLGQHGVQDNDAWHPDLVQQVQDLTAVRSAVDAVLVLHDGDIAQVQLRGRPTERGGVINDELRHHLVAGL